LSFLGLDIGSVSLKFVLLEGDKVTNKIYLKNEGLIKTLQKGLSLLPNIGLEGIGITGSGKEFVKVLIKADYTDSEIMAHVVAAVKEYPDLKTIIDIGGEDSKLMLVKNNVLADFQMNRDCGGGTGSMIETIATRLGVNIEDVGDIALQSEKPANLPGKCGIFAQSAVVSEVNKGRPVPDILLGVCRALTGNYLATLAKGKKLQSPIVFQGATAQNKALVKCFERELKQPILVPENCSYMGAIGIAILTRENRINSNGRCTSNLMNGDYTTQFQQCNDCENRCELLRIYRDDKLIGVTGSRCGKWNKEVE